MPISVRLGIFHTQFFVLVANFYVSFLPIAFVSKYLHFSEERERARSYQVKYSFDFSWFDVYFYRNFFRGPAFGSFNDIRKTGVNLINKTQNSVKWHKNDRWLLRKILVYVTNDLIKSNTVLTFHDLTSIFTEFFSEVQRLVHFTDIHKPNKNISKFCKIIEKWLFSVKKSTYTSMCHYRTSLLL